MMPLALVTGASRGIGRAVALALGAKGMAVIVHYRANREAAQSTAGLIKAAGGTAHLVKGDLATGAGRKRIRDKVIALGSLSILVQNAGAAPDKRIDLLKEDDASVQRMLAVNLAGPWLLARDLAPLIMKSKAAGRGIIWITSVSAALATTERAGYCLAKAGAAMGAKLLALRLAPAGVPVWEIRPGIIETDMTAPVIKKYRKRAAAGLIPQGRTGQPEDVANLVATLLEGTLTYSSGSVINVDGGLHLERL